MTVDTHDEDSDTDAVPLAANTDHPPADTAIRPCDVCDGGVIWRDETTKQLVCDSCHTVHETRDTLGAPNGIHMPSDHDRREHDEYENSDRRRCHGGYRRAYLSRNTGPEYAIDAYDDHTDGLLTPHKRDWAI